MADHTSASSSPDGASTQVRQTAFSATELMDMEFKPVRWLIPGLLPEGLAVLAGKPKIGKSWLTLGWALDLAVAGPVLYLALEDPPRRLRSRMEILLGNRRVPSQLEFHVDWPRLDGEGLSRLEDWLAEHATARAVFIDTLARVRPPRRGGEDQYLGDNETWGPLQQLASRHPGVLVLANHHQRKGVAEDVVDTVLGTQGLTGSVDTVAVLAKPRNSTDAELFVTGRDVEETSRALHFEDGRWTDLGDAAQHRMLVEHEELGSVLAGGPLTRAEVADLLDLKPEAARSRLRRAREKGMVTELEDKRWALIEGVRPTDRATLPTRATDATEDHRSVGRAVAIPGRSTERPSTWVGFGEALKEAMNDPAAAAEAANVEEEPWSWDDWEESLLEEVRREEHLQRLKADGLA